MIHQLIFAHPKPGMSEEEFQHYWVHVHAPTYASRIPQIRRYAVDTRIPFGPEPADPLWSGIAEIWLEDEEQQLASLQSTEFVDGARVDEPRWAAFWRTIALDTDAHVLRTEPLPVDAVKLVVLVKRRAGSSLEEFRKRALGDHAATALGIPGLRRYLQCHNRDGAYAVGEALLDAAFLLSFDSAEALESAAADPSFERTFKDLEQFTEPRYIHTMAVRENWVIGSDDYLTKEARR